MMWLTLLGYEFKKMFHRKTFWISLVGVYLLLLLVNSMWIFGNVYVEGTQVATSRQLARDESQAGKKLNGLLLTNEVIQEAFREEAQFPGYTAEHFLEENRKALKSQKITELFGNLMGSMGEGITETETGRSEADTDTPDYYQSWREYVRASFSEEGLTPVETAYWETSLEQVETPWRYAYNEAYARFLNMQSMNLFLTALAIVICLAPLFAQECTAKTDALILSGKFGRQEVFWAKITTGILFSVLWSVLVYGSVLLEEIMIYGAGDLTVPIQTLPAFFGSAWQASVGSMLLILLLCSILASVLTALFAMLCSAGMKSAFGPVILGLILTFLPVFLGSVPRSFRSIYLITQLLPGKFASVDSLFGGTIFSIGGLSLRAYEYIPIAYVGIGAACLLLAGYGYLKRRRV